MPVCLVPIQSRNTQPYLCLSGYFVCYVLLHVTDVSSPRSVS